jgi:hypothetical protein
MIYLLQEIDVELAKTCLPLLARGYSVLATSLGRQSHRAEEALTIDPGFSMASINLDHAQFWDPLSNAFLHRQYAASSNSTSKSTYTTSSRNQPALLNNKPAGMFKRNDQSTSAIAPAQHQGDDSAARAQGKIRENARNEHV